MIQLSMIFSTIAFYYECCKSGRKRQRGSGLGGLFKSGRFSNTCYVCFNYAHCNQEFVTRNALYAYTKCSKKTVLLQIRYKLCISWHLFSNYIIISNLNSTWWLCYKFEISYALETMKTSCLYLSLQLHSYTKNNISF